MAHGRVLGGTREPRGGIIVFSGGVAILFALVVKFAMPREKVTIRTQWLDI